MHSNMLNIKNGCAALINAICPYWVKVFISLNGSACFDFNFNILAEIIYKTKHLYTFYTNTILSVYKLDTVLRTWMNCTKLTWRQRKYFHSFTVYLLSPPPLCYFDAVTNTGMGLFQWFCSSDTVPVKSIDNAVLRNSVLRHQLSFYHFRLATAPQLKNHWRTTQTRAHLVCDVSVCSV